MLRDHRPLRRFTYTIGLAGIVLLLLPLVPGLGTEKFGARIWIEVGRYSFQPAEAAKVLLSIAFAGYLVEKRDVLALAGYRVLGLDLPRARDLGPIGVIWALSLAILVLQRDLGTSLLFFGLFVMMLYVATERPGWVVLGTLLFAGGAYFGYLIFSHVQVRVGAWLDPFADYDAYFQVINAQFGMAWGGLLGTGLGLGRPGLTPLARSDFIAAAIGEELGMTGLMAVIMIYGLIVARGLRTALQCREPFGKLLAAGLSFAFALQVFTIIGGVTRLLPLTGLTTPFMSQGGSSLICNWIVVAPAAGDQPPGPQAGGHRRSRPNPDIETTQLIKAGFHAMNKPIRRVAFVAMMMFALLLANGTYMMIFRQSSLAAEPQNRRVRDAEFAQDRGDDPGDRQEADRRDRAGRRHLQVPAGLSRRRAVRADHRLLLLRPRPDRRWRTATTPQLAGTDDALFVRRLVDLVTNRTPEGASVQTTIVPKVQKAAAEALGNQKGAVVALDPQHRRRAGHGDQPELRPEPDRQPRHRRGRQGLPPAGRTTPTGRCPTARRGRSTRRARPSSW